jgi:PIN domain nuclease of toxin-antitoxin system
VKLLLDTCCWLWWLSEPNKLSQQQLKAIRNRHNHLFLSVASIWELSIKINHGKISSLPQSLNKLVENECRKDGITILDIKPCYVIPAGSLVLHHKDPFDRMIITQAIIDNLTIATADSIFQKYNVPILF